MTNLICSKKELLKRMEIIETVISSHATIPILSNFLLEIENKKVKLAATDLEIGVRCYINNAKVNQTKDVITLPAKRFIGIIKELPDKEDIEIKIDTEKNCQAEIKSGKSHFLILGTPKEDFPDLPEFNESKSVNVNTKEFEEMVKKTIFSISKDDTRPALTGIYFVIEDNQINLVSTDGRRLSFIYRDCKTDHTSMKGIVLPKVINELLTILNIEKSENFKINITENQIGFKVNDIILVSRLVDGKFPNYEQVIPKKNPIKVTINTDELLTAVKQLSLLTMEEGGAVRFLFTKNNLQLSIVSQGIGSGEVEIDIEFEGPDLDVAFNSKYIIDILKNLGEDQVMFEMNGPADSVVIRAIKDEKYLCVCMPVRIV